jgi:hypothetical protein
MVRERVLEVGYEGGRAWLFAELDGGIPARFSPASTAALARGRRPIAHVLPGSSSPAAANRSRAPPNKAMDPTRAYGARGSLPSR